MNRRRMLLLVDQDPADAQWVIDNITARFRNFSVVPVRSVADAHNELITRVYDLVVTDLLGDEDKPFNTVHDLVAISPTMPIIVLTATALAEEHMLDIVAAGVKHILYKEDVRKDVTRLVSAVIEVIQEVSRSDAIRDSHNERMYAIAKKVHDVDNRARTIEGAINGLVQSVNALVQVVEKRGGLEDRIKDLEDTRQKAVKIGLWAAGVGGSLVAAIVTGIFNLMKK
mgnify:CR=1 FL=1